MNKYSSYLLATALLVLPACSSQTAKPAEPTVTTTLARSDEGPLKQKETQLVEAQAVVKKVDYKTRAVELKVADGSTVKITASPEIKRLNEIKKGDKVVVKYFESLALEVQQPTSKELAKKPLSAVVVGKRGDELPPGMGAASVTRSIVTVKAIDLKNETVGVLLPDGKNIVVKARYPENLTRIKPGDKVAVTYSEALAVSIDPAA